jgi:LPS sulfotransferase NodH
MSIVRPVIIVSPPRSGSTLLFETLSMSPDLWSVGGESHYVLEGIPALHPRARAWESNRLGTADADRETVRLVRRRFHTAMRDRDGRRAQSVRADLRLLEKTPRNTLRVPFLRSVFPAATFVHLHREPAETMSSMLDGWRSGRHISYRRLPGWRGLPWSFLLVPRWRSLPPHDLARTVAHQWATSTSMLVDDLATVPPGQVCAVRYCDLVADPAALVSALCDRLELRWDRPIGRTLPLSSTTLDKPEPDKWRRNAVEILPMVAATTRVAARAEDAARRCSLA